MKTKHYRAEQDGLYEMIPCETGDYWLRVREFPKERGPIRKALSFIGAMVFGLLFFYGLIWLFAIGCVAAGHGYEVCGL
mgnify:CR=1 FL=1